MHLYVAVPVTAALVYRAYSRKSLTPFGIVVAAVTATVHAVHPWSIFFALLVVFFLAGTTVTKVKHGVKANLTQSSSGASGGEGARTHIQVLANSVVASILILLHYRQLQSRKSYNDEPTGECWAYRGDLLVVGIVSNYAAVSADTFSSELGILSRSKPRLLTSWKFRQVPPGTNGGVTLAGTLAGFAGAFIIALTSAILMPFCSADTIIGGKTMDKKSGFEGGSSWGWQEKIFWVILVTIWGGLGSALDSALGGWFQASVVDARTGKVVEGVGGKKVLVSGSLVPASKKSDEPSRRIESGLGLLDNNAVNLLMAFLMSVGGICITSYVWHIPLSLSPKQKTVAELRSKNIFSALPISPIYLTRLLLKPPTKTDTTLTSAPINLVRHPRPSSQSPQEYPRSAIARKLPNPVPRLPPQADLHHGSSPTRPPAQHIPFQLSSSVASRSLTWRVVGAPSIDFFSSSCLEQWSYEKRKEKKRKQPYRNSTRTVFRSQLPHGIQNQHMGHLSARYLQWLYRAGGWEEVSFGWFWGLAWGDGRRDMLTLYGTDAGVRSSPFHPTTTGSIPPPTGLRVNSENAFHEDMKSEEAGGGMRVRMDTTRISVEKNQMVDIGVGDLLMMPKLRICKAYFLEKTIQ